MDARLCWACERRMPREDGWQRLFRWCDDAQRVCDFWGVLRVNEVGSRHELYIPTSIDPESDNLMKQI